MSQCNHTRGTSHVFKRMSQLRQEGLQSLITSSVSFIAYSITHFLSSSIPYFSPPILCRPPGKVKRENSSPQMYSSDCIFIRKQGQRGRKARRSDKTRKSGRTPRSHWRVDWTRLEWTEIDLNNETSSLTLTTIKWMTAADGKIRTSVCFSFFSYCFTMSEERSQKH